MVANQRLANIKPLEDDLRVVKQYQPVPGSDAFLGWLSFISKQSQDKARIQLDLDLKMV